MGKYESTELRVDDMDQFHIECGTKDIPISEDDKQLLYTIVLLLATWMGIALNICFKVFYKPNPENNNNNYTEFTNEHHDHHEMDVTPPGSPPNGRSRANTGSGLFSLRINDSQANREEQNSL